MSFRAVGSLVGLVLCLVVSSLVAASPAGAVAGYGDVAEGRYFTEPVQWSVDEGITGIDGNCFGPDAPVSRGEAAVYIWNMQGQPSAPAHSFVDVTDESQDAAVSWMSHNEITTGTSPTTFDPDGALNRAHLVTFLWRLADRPSAHAHPFVDVHAPWQQGSVSWAADRGITTGTTPTTFSPDTALTRAHLVTFLYRYQNKPVVTVDPASPECDPPTTTPTTTITRTRWPALQPEPTVTADRQLVAWNEVLHEDLTSAQARIIQDLPWFGDGIDVDEKPAAEVLTSLPVLGPETFLNVIDRAWVQDGINIMEYNVLWIMTHSFLERMGDQFTSAIANMPFLDTFEPADAFAFYSLTELMLRGADDRHFKEIWNHPAVSDGIDDDEAKTLSKLLVIGWDGYDSESLESLKLLEPEQFEVSRRTIELPLAGAVEITIQHRRGTGWVEYMDHIATGLTILEEFMSTPLPTEQVNLIVSYNIEKLGTRNTQHLIFIPRQYTNSDGSPVLGSVHFHELAHYYWYSGRLWIAEGTARFLDYTLFAALRGATPRPRFELHDRCSTILNLSQLEALGGDQPGGCAYPMGASLFWELYQDLGEHSFRTGFRRLYQLSQHDDPHDECTGIELNICHVRAAFMERTGEEVSDTANEVIDKWYDGEYPRLEGTSGIHGIVLSSDGKPLQDIGMYLDLGNGAGYSTISGADGKFSFGEAIGTYKLRVIPPEGCSFEGWYSGAEQLTSIDRATKLVSDGSLSESIEIRIPVLSSDLHCGSLAIRGILVLPDRGISIIPGTGRELREFSEIRVYAEVLEDIDSFIVFAPFNPFDFELFVPDGLTIKLRFQGITRSGEWLELGWLGEDGLTSDASKAVTFNPDGEDIEGVEIDLRALP